MDDIEIPNQVAMRELKAGLSRYVAQARAGAAIEITLHDKPVARLIGISPQGPAGVSRLIAAGAAQWRGGKPSLRPPIALEGGGTSLSSMVLEDRG